VGMKCMDLWLCEWVISCVCTVDCLLQYIQVHSGISRYWRKPPNGGRKTSDAISFDSSVDAFLRKYGLYGDEYFYRILTYMGVHVWYILMIPIIGSQFYGWYMDKLLANNSFFTK
jgi:hypothetical protein